MTHAFSDLLFPLELTYGSSGGPAFSTDVHTTRYGHEQRITRWARPRRRYRIAPAIRCQEDCRTLSWFFQTHRGRAVAFRFFDPLDHHCPRHRLGIGNGTRTRWPLVHRIALPGMPPLEEPLQAPVLASWRLWIQGTNCTEWDWDAQDHCLVFATPPPLDHIIEAEGSYHIPVRFDHDNLEWSIESHGAYAHTTLTLVEVPL